MDLVADDSHVESNHKMPQILDTSTINLLHKTGHASRAYDKLSLSSSPAHGIPPPCYFQLPMSGSSPTTGGAQFLPFSRLPIELRRSIWRTCRPNRVIDIDLLPNPCDLKTVCRGVGQTSVLNSKPPIITRICKESRAVAFERDPAHDETQLSEDTAPGSDSFFRFWERQPYWFNASADTIHLNWNPDLEFNSWDNDGNPIPEFLRVASKGMGASFTAQLLFPFNIGDLPSYPHFDFRRDGANFELLESGKEYLVILEMIILHTKVEDTLASELFGFIGEERVILVKASDENTVRQYEKLWLSGQPEDQEPEDFFQEVFQSRVWDSKVTKWKHELEVYWMRFKCEQAVRNGTVNPKELDSVWFKTVGPVNFRPEIFEDGPGSDWSPLFDKKHPFAKEVLETMPQFSPVIMFRLCEKNCYAEHD